MVVGMFVCVHVYVRGSIDLASTPLQAFCVIIRCGIESYIDLNYE